LGKKYKLNHTEDELNKRKELQDPNKYLHIKRNKIGYNGFNKTWKWLRKYYLNSKGKDSIESWEYGKEMRNMFFKSIFESMLKSVGYTFLFYIWMRAVKQKGKKDLVYLFLINSFISLNTINTKMYSFPIVTKLPLNIKDLENRKELIEELVFSGSKSYILTEEIKKISNFYVREKIEYSYITSLGQKITFIVVEGRMYLLCDNYAEVFGFTGKNKLSKINNLDVMNLREKEIVIGLFRLYDVMIDRYVKLNNIDKTKQKNLITEIFQDVVKDKMLFVTDINTIKQTKILKGVEFEKLQSEKNIEDVKSVLGKSSSAEEKLISEKETKFYI